jgi:DNA topoisomerase-1
MKESFPEIVDYEFTAQMEEKLDSIEHGGTTMQDILKSFYDDFEKSLNTAMETVKKEELPVEESEIICDKCGRKMIYRTGRFGKFLACPGYPLCRNTMALDSNGNVVEKKTQEPEKKADFKCEVCGADMVVRKGRFGEFYACSNYPTCRFTKQIVQDTGVPCPKCGAKLIVRRSRDRKIFYSCEKYPACDYSTWDMPLKETCPECGSMLVYKKLRKLVSCSNANCEYSRQQDIKVIE